MNSYIILEKQLQDQKRHQLEDDQGAYPWNIGSFADSPANSDISSHFIDGNVPAEVADFLSVYENGSNGLLSVPSTRPGSTYAVDWRKTPFTSRRTSNCSIESTDTDLDTSVEGWTRGDCFYVYMAACRRLRQVPVTAVQDSLYISELRLSYQNLLPLDVKAMCIALAVNSVVKEIDVSYNCIQVEGLQYITDLMMHNKNITKLNVSFNDIGSHGLVSLTNVLENSKVLTHLDAAGNDFGLGSKHLSRFTASIQNNTVLESLDLGYNAFDETSGLLWAHVLGNNYGLSRLILCWNHLRWKGVQYMLRAIELNETLKVLDLAWNGVANEGARILGRILLYNTVLEEIDLTCNRISMEGCISICQGLLRNTTLKVLKISKNPITNNGAISILETYQENTDSALKRLELMDVEVDRYFEAVYDEIKNSKQPLEVIHGGLITEGDAFLQTGKKKRPILGDPLTLLFEHVKNSNLRLWDIFAQFDKDKSLSISRDEFRNGMKEARLPLDEFHIERIINTLDKDKNGEITFEELLEGFKRYKEKERRKYETLLPEILQRPSSARRDSGLIDENAPVARTNRSNIMSMQGSVGEASHLKRPSLSLPAISVTTNADVETSISKRVSRTYTLLPQMNLGDTSCDSPPYNGNMDSISNYDSKRHTNQTGFNFEEPVPIITSLTETDDVPSGLADISELHSNESSIVSQHVDTPEEDSMTHLRVNVSLSSPLSKKPFTQDSTSDNRNLSTNRRTSYDMLSLKNTLRKGNSFQSIKPQGRSGSVPNGRHALF